MPLDIQNVAVYLIVAGVALAVIRQALRRKRGCDGDCGCEARTRMNPTIATILRRTEKDAKAGRAERGR